MPAKRFAKLAQNHQPVAEVVAVEEVMVTATPVEGIKRFAKVIFDNDAEGFVWQISANNMKILLLLGEIPTIGTLLVDTGELLSTEVSRDLLGRVVDPLLRPLDGKGEILAKKTRRIFADAPSFAQRDILESQLETGVSLVDMLFPIVKGQRIAFIGDAKSGKSSLALQALIHQASQNTIGVLVLICKRTEDVRNQLRLLQDSGAITNMVVIVSEPDKYLPLNYIAPYVGAAIAESFWYSGHDVVVCYDDLTHHAKIYREMSLRLGVPAGREGYPGDMFYMHSSLLERAGKLSNSGSTQTVLAIGTTPNGDLTSYLSTSLISMTDGQLVFDLETLHKGRKPAVDINLSVSRVGGRAQSVFAQSLSRNIRLALARARSAEQFNRFGGQTSRTVLEQRELASRLYESFEQGLTQSYTLLQQQLLFSAILQAVDPANISVPWLKTVIADVTKQPIAEKDIPNLAAEMSHSNPNPSTAAEQPQGKTNG